MALSLPTLPRTNVAAHTLQEHLPRIVWAERRGRVLHNTPLSQTGDVLGLGLTKGCGHQCSFCSVRGHPDLQGDEWLYAFANTAMELNEELTQRQRLPRAVVISPSGDPFPPIREIQEEAARVVAVLARYRIESWLMTRGFIRPAILEALIPHRERIKITVGLTTLDRTLQRQLESLTAPPRLRLRQIRRLRDLDFDVRIALEPLIPGLTDTPANLKPLLEAIAQAGVRQVSVGYLFLRPGIEANLNPVLKKLGACEEMEEAFAKGPWLTAPGFAAARYLPRSRRQRGYAAIMAFAADLGLKVHVNATTNPDFAPPRPLPLERAPRQSLFPLFDQIVPVRPIT